MIGNLSRKASSGLKTLYLLKSHWGRIEKEKGNWKWKKGVTVSYKRDCRVYLKKKCLQLLCFLSNIFRFVFIPASFLPSLKKILSLFCFLVVLLRQVFLLADILFALLYNKFIFLVNAWSLASEYNCLLERLDKACCRHLIWHICVCSASPETTYYSYCNNAG